MTIGRIKWNAANNGMWTAAKVWGSTAGPYFPGLFRYAIGGEW
jgi:hypothetical protein